MDYGEYYARRRLLFSSTSSDEKTLCGSCKAINSWTINYKKWK